MMLDKKKKNKIIHFGAILFLIFAIIVFITVLFITFEINLDDFFSKKEEMKVKVINNYDNPLFVSCVYYNDIGEDDLSIKVYRQRIEPKENHVFIHEYDKINRVAKIGVAAYSSFNYYSDEKIVDASYAFLEENVYDLLAVINDSGDTITITKLQ